MVNVVIWRQLRIVGCQSPLAAVVYRTRCTCGCTAVDTCTAQGMDACRTFLAACPAEAWLDASAPYCSGQGHDWVTRAASMPGGRSASLDVRPAPESGPDYGPDAVLEALTSCFQEAGVSQITLPALGAALRRRRVVIKVMTSVGSSVCPCP